MKLRVLVVLCVALAAPAVAEAHGIGVEAKLKAGRVAVEGYFDDDTPAADAKVKVTADDGKVIAEGKADAKGLWSFPAPPPGKYRVELNAGGGHLAKTTITIPPATPGSADPGTATEGTAATGEDEVVVSDGPTRAEAFGRRWLMLLEGVTLIGLLAVAAWWVVRRPATGREADPQEKTA